MSGKSDQTTVIVPTGALGAGMKAEHVKRGLSVGAHAIALDAGSTDSGPSYLARGVSKFNREAVKHDLAIVMAARAEANIPLLVGTCGTSGCDDAVNWTRDIVMEIAREQGSRPRIATLYSEQDKTLLKTRNAAGKIHPLAPSGPVSDAVIDSCNHIVALMGPEPYIEALEDGADIVLGGRTTDTAVLAAVPLMRGAGRGAAWHAGKTAECGGVCTVNRGEGGVMIHVGVDSFEVEPLALSNRCSPHSVSAHMLYENSNPYRLTEPGGILDVTQAVYTSIDDRIVRVTGSRFDPKPYTMKLEGARGGPFQTISMIGIADPEVLANLDLFDERLHAGMVNRIKTTFGAEAGDFDVSLRIYGWNGLTGLKPPEGSAPPLEVGVVMVITAATQDLATRMSKTCNPLFFHFPLKPGSAQPSYAFPFTPAEIERGQVYEFVLNHVVETTGGCELVRREMVDLGAPTKRTMVDA